MKRKIPNHVGIIMDGNGRWAVRHGLIRTQGHNEGIHAAKRCVKSAIDLGIRHLSLYVFSTENWNRPQEEVNILLSLIANNLRKEEQFYIDNEIRVVHSGSKAGMPEHIIEEITWVEARTELFHNIMINLAINYGGQDEIVRAINRFYQENDHTAAITVENITEHLDAPLLPSPDLIIRTGGECRLSNFMLWESAYAELYFSDKLWPDWQSEDLETAVQTYSARQRSFGGKRSAVKT